MPQALTLVPLTASGNLQTLSMVIAARLSQDAFGRPSMESRASIGGVIALSALLVTGARASGQEAERPRLTVLAYNYAGIPAERMAEATAIVGRIYGAAGIDVDWLDPLADPRFVVSPTKNSLRGFTVEMLIRPKRPDIWAVNLDWVMGNAFAAGRSGGILWLFYDQIQHVALGYDRPTAEVLALAMAHEIGHLLLPHPAHCVTGVMRAEWDEKDLRGGDLFRLTPEQATTIRDRLSRCCGSVRDRTLLNAAVNVPPVR